MKTRTTVLLRNTVNWGTGIPGLSGDEICLQLTRGYLSLISREDADELSAHNWSAQEFKSRVAAIRGTPRSDGKQKMILLHREISQPLPDQDVDHRDQHKFFVHRIVDNRRHNLRNVTASQNNANQRKCVGCSSRYKGVCWNKQNEKWRAHIKVNLRSIHLGSFVNETEAAEAYNTAHESYFPGIHEGLNLIAS